MKTLSCSVAALVLTGACGALVAASAMAARPPANGRGPDAARGQLRVEVCSQPTPHRRSCIGIAAEEWIEPSTSVEVTETFYDTRTGQDGSRWASCVLPSRSVLATTRSGAAIELAVREPACSRGGTIRDVDTGELIEWAFPKGMRAAAYIDNARYLTQVVSSVASTDTVLGTSYRERCVSHEGGGAEGTLTVGQRAATFDRDDARVQVAYYVHRSCRVLTR